VVQDTETFHFEIKSQKHSRFESQKRCSKKVHDIGFVISMRANGNDEGVSAAFSAPAWR
jgi:hypothetical protein